MQPRRLRLGDILDDYCPRERRITNHAVVAMIDDDVKQTRCATCDAEHEYREAKVPAVRRRKAATPPSPDQPGPRPAAPASPDSMESLPPGVVDATTEPPLSAEAAHAPTEEAGHTRAEAGHTRAEGGHTRAEAGHAGAKAGHARAEVAPGEGTDEDRALDEDRPSDDDRTPDDEGPVHRRLIRATLPRQEGQVPERKAPDFTMHQPAGRGRDTPQNKRGGRHRNRRGPARQNASGGNAVPRVGGSQTPRDGNRHPRPHTGPRAGQPAGQGRGPRPAAGRGPKRGRE